MDPAQYAGKSAYHGDVAARYEEDRMKEPLWADEQEFVRRWTGHLSRGATVLDLPVGTGRFLEILLTAGLRVRAMDISEDMLAEVRKRPVSAGADLVIARGDAEHLDLPDGAIDHVLCWRLFHLLPLPTIERALSEFRRVCRGTIVVQVLPVREGGLITAMPAAIKKILRPIRRKLMPSLVTPWSHIPSFVHPERSLLTIFRRQGLKVRETATMARYNGHPVRVYTLEREPNAG
jgi:ubiquinone/menaquinone biosynthesis C-methylase UbiE